MEIRQFAERILFGTSWDEKLLALDRYEDKAPGASIATPAAPGRPEGLGFDEWYGRQKLNFRDVRNFHSEKECGLVLHFFANHELLALELMALALLKFPDAPGKFRRGLVQTLKDEQEHVRLYQKRMTEIGVEFGEIPVSDFFWKAIGPMESPTDFVSSLSMTLEQANLDYAVHYAAIYRQLDDAATAAILDRVYRDEIGHVKHGLTWFNRWRSCEESEWNAYRQALHFPLSAARAKGIGFNRQGRTQAGFSAAYIDELELFSQSRGRCPAVHWFNANCEGQVALGRPGFTPPKLAAQLDADLQALPMLSCARDDALLLREKPSASFLRRLQSLGFAIPEFVEYGAGGLADTLFAARKVNALSPWGWSPDSARFLKPLVGGLPERSDGIYWSEEVRRLYAKSWSAARLNEFLTNTTEEFLCGDEVVGSACTTVEDVLAQIARLSGTVVIKAIYGSSGRDQIHCRDQVLRDGQRGWLDNILAQQGEVVVEPWLDKVVDLSLHVDVAADGTAALRGWTRFLTDGRGQYRGALVGQVASGLEVEVKKFLYGAGRDPKRLTRIGERLAEFLAAPMAAVGYRGPVGIDTLIYREDGGLKLKPIVEINPRMTMGRVALGLRQRINSARTALWVVLSAREVQAAGYADLADYARQLEAQHPMRLMPDGEQLCEGAVFTTDPTRAQAFATVLLVGDSFAMCESQLIGAGLALI